MIAEAGRAGGTTGNARRTGTGATVEGTIATGIGTGIAVTVGETSGTGTTEGRGTSGRGAGREGGSERARSLARSARGAFWTIPALVRATARVAGFLSNPYHCADPLGERGGASSWRSIFPVTERKQRRRRPHLAREGSAGRGTQPLLSAPTLLSEIRRVRLPAPSQGPPPRETKAGKIARCRCIQFIGDLDYASKDSRSVAGSDAKLLLLPPSPPLCSPGLDFSRLRLTSSPWDLRAAARSRSRAA